MAFNIDDEPTPNSGQPAADESAEIMESMPDPQQHAIDAASEEINSTGGSSADLDAENTAWDPAIHSTGADGKGIKTSKGLWRKKRGAARHTSTIGGGSSRVVTPTQNVAPQADVLAAQAKAAGTAAAMSVFAIGRAFGGEDWQPTPAEVTAMSEAYGNYFIAKGITDFPPGLAVVIATAGYAGPRFFTPATRERVGTIKHWFGIRLAKWRVKKALKKHGIDAVVTIRGSQAHDVYDNILVNGKPFNEIGLKVKPDDKRDIGRAN